MELTHEDGRVCRRYPSGDWNSVVFRCSGRCPYRADSGIWSFHALVNALMRARYLNRRAGSKAYKIEVKGSHFHVVLVPRNETFADTHGEEFTFPCLQCGHECAEVKPTAQTMVICPSCGYEYPI